MRNVSRALDSTTAQKAASGDTVYVNIHYTVVGPDQPPLALLKSQHHIINAAFNNIHEALGRVPSSGRYNFASVVGKTSVVFLPTAYTDLTEESVTRIPGGRSDFSGLNDVTNYLSLLGYSFLRSNITLIICPMSSILGEAEVGGSIACATTASVGGELVAGSLPTYSKGVTSVHEIGHLFGLPHTWGDGGCDKIFDDIPAQRDPNYLFQLSNSGGVWDGSGCNRHRDCRIYADGDMSATLPGVSPPYSCNPCGPGGSSQCDTDCSTGTFEQGCNFMDYGGDDHLVMFSAEQALFMRRTLLSSESTIQQHEWDGGELIPSSSASVAAVAVEDENGTAAKGGLSTAAIVGIVVGALLALGIIVAVSVTVTKRR